LLRYVQISLVEHLGDLSFNQIEEARIFRIDLCAHDQLISLLKFHNFFISGAHNANKHIKKGNLSQECLQKVKTPEKMAAGVPIVGRGVSLSKTKQILTKYSVYSKHIFEE
jgi:hypothetical protein